MNEDKFDLAEELEWAASEGYCPNVLYDDNGNWAISDESFSNVQEEIDSLSVMIFVEANWFRPTLREAWNVYLKRIMG